MSLYNSGTSSSKLKIPDVLKVLEPDGPLARHLKGFEARHEQKEMMSNVLEAYNNDQIALIEAGTGTGKSLAYLIPAMLWAAQTKERTVISTNTITLQEQLLHKDIPILLKALNLDLKSTLVKGMQNYLCMRKFHETEQEFLQLTPQEGEELQKIDAWKETTPDGSRSTLPFNPSFSIWEKVCAESDTCNRNKCPYFQECFFFKERRQANEAQLLIVNHHLLFADLVRRAEAENYKDPAILPAYTRIVLDEAHNIEDIATDYFASRLSQMDIMRLTARLASEKGDKIAGKLPILKDKIAAFYRNNFSQAVTSINNRLNIDLPGLRRDLLKITVDSFSGFFDFVQKMQGFQRSEEQGPAGENKLRILNHHQTSPQWTEILKPQAIALRDSINRYAQALQALTKDIKQLDNSLLEEQIKSITFEIDALSVRFSGFAAIIEAFLAQVDPQNDVRWIEVQPLKTMINTALVNADLDIANTLATHLFKKFSSVILCSATLTTAGHFHFIRDRLGLTEKHLGSRTIVESIYNSPFNFTKQALLTVPTDIPDPTHPSFIREAAENIWLAIKASKGNAFVLFTSYSMLKSCFEILHQRLIENRYHPLKHGDDDRRILLNKFKAIDRSVLFGTDSFWEGVDVVGDALRCVIIVKLPFKVPSEPLIQARSEAIASRGGDPFMEYSLPQAIVKFKQGFGRLIRNRADRGCIVCLDNRLNTKRYGQQFLSSLPNCQRAFVPSSEMQSLMTNFYKQTHYLVKDK